MRSKPKWGDNLGGNAVAVHKFGLGMDLRYILFDTINRTY